MAAGTPLTRLTLGAASVTDDLGYVALSDLARTLGDIAADCRVIGGHMVTVLAAICGNVFKRPRQVIERDIAEIIGN